MEYFDTDQITAQSVAVEDYYSRFTGPEIDARLAEVMPHVQNSTIHITSAERTAWNGKQPTITDLATIRSGAALGATAVQPATLNAHVNNTTVHITSAERTAWNGKQDAITDLATIRNNASLGATAYGWGNHANAGYVNTTDEQIINGAKYFTSSVYLRGNEMGLFGIQNGTPVDLISFNSNSIYINYLQRNERNLTLYGKTIKMLGPAKFSDSAHFDSTVYVGNLPIIYDAEKRAVVIDGNIIVSGNVAGFGGIGMMQDVELTSLKTSGNVSVGGIIQMDHLLVSSASGITNVISFGDFQLLYGATPCAQLLNGGMMFPGIRIGSSGIFITQIDIETDATGTYMVVNNHRFKAV